MVVVLVAAMCRQARLQGLMSISFWRPDGPGCPASPPPPTARSRASKALVECRHCHLPGPARKAGWGEQFSGQEDLEPESSSGPGLGVILERYS
jgi:hypothetical protein